MKEVKFIPKVAPHFSSRVQRNLHQFQERQQESEIGFDMKNWHAIEGNYEFYSLHTNIFATHREDTTLKGMENLVGIELYFKDLINDFLIDKSAKPVVAVDLGGMNSLSWCRLGRHFQEEIQQGKVILVSTSLDFDIDKDGRYKYSYHTDDQFIRENKQFVNYIQSDMSTLKHQKIQTPNEEIFLSQNVDIMFEEMSVSQHSPIPESDISYVPDLLSPRGIYFTKARNMVSEYY